MSLIYFNPCQMQTSCMENVPVALTQSHYELDIMYYYVIGIL